MFTGKSSPPTDAHDGCSSVHSSARPRARSSPAHPRARSSRAPPSVCASQAPPSARTPKCPFQQWDCRIKPYSPQGNFLGGGGSRAVQPWRPESPDPPRRPESPDPPRPTESSDPPWPPELPASPWRSPVSPSWSSLQGAHPASPVDMLRRRTRLSGGGDNVRVLDSLFFVFPLSFLIWLFFCSS